LDTCRSAFSVLMRAKWGPWGTNMTPTYITSAMVAGCKNSTSGYTHGPNKDTFTSIADVWPDAIPFREGTITIDIHLLEISAEPSYAALRDEI